MKTKEQKVEIYKTLASAKYEMEENIRNGWYIHTCLSNNYEYNSYNRIFSEILVIYERELEAWN